MFWNYKIEFDFSELSSSSSHNKACDAWGPPCHATMYSSSLLLNIPTLIIIHLFLQSRRWIAFTRQTILNDFRKWNFRWHFVYNIFALYTYSSIYDDGSIASICIAYILHRQLILSKGQLISKGNFKVFIWTKNPTKIEAEIEKYFRWFLGSNEKFRICFRDKLTFSWYSWSFSRRLHNLAPK